MKKKEIQKAYNSYRLCMRLKNAPDKLSRKLYKKVKKEWDKAVKEINFAHLSKLEANFQTWKIKKKSDDDSM